MIGARSVGGGFSADRLAAAFAHSLVPIALVYVAAHYLTLLLFRVRPLLSSHPTRLVTAPICSGPPTVRSITG